MGSQLAASAARFGWYVGLNRLVDAETRRHGLRTLYRPKRPVPDRQELMGALASLFLADAEAVRRGLFPAAEPIHGKPLQQFERAREMLADLPAALARRASEDADSVKDAANVEGLPAYYLQDFHFQTGGYLTEASARLYDVQVETLFYGSAGAMRRAALPVIAEEIRGRDQRRLNLLDVACGTGRFLREVRLAWPALGLAGLDLSPAYLEEARRHTGKLRPVRLLEGSAEAIPFENASQDIVTCVFLFHELPPEVRQTVASEMVRVLKPGGLLVFIDSLQMGDRPSWDGLLETFPVRFHEPYFRHYAIDDLDALFRGVGLDKVSRSLAFLSKMTVWRRPN